VVEYACGKSQVPSRQRGVRLPGSGVWPSNTTVVGAQLIQWYFRTRRSTRSISSGFSQFN
jgi:hypothetical protein